MLYLYLATLYLRGQRLAAAAVLDVEDVVDHLVEAVDGGEGQGRLSGARVLQRTYR